METYSPFAPEDDSQFPKYCVILKYQVTEQVQDPNNQQYSCQSFFYHFEMFDLCAIDFLGLLTNGCVTALTGPELTGNVAFTQTISFTEMFVSYINR
jgi:hypothetical protein